jgi:hypothetical protein
MAPILTAEAAEVIGAAMPVRPSTVRCLSAYGREMPLPGLRSGAWRLPCPAPASIIGCDVWCS